MNKKPAKSQKVGGIAFYLSLLTLFFLVLLCLALLPSLFDTGSPANLAKLCAGIFLGVLLTSRLIRGRLSIFIHELKHSIVSNLVGNKAKRLKVEKNSGSFEYEYSASTAHMNAFISLAPYYFPLCTLCLALLVALFFRSEFEIALLLLGTGLGADLVLNIRDVSAHQPDFSDLNGGFGIGLIYTVLANLLSTLIVLAYALAGATGLQQLLYGIWFLVKRFLFSAA